jgi:hypothetical protein
MAESGLGVVATMSQPISAPLIGVSQHNVVDGFNRGSRNVPSLRLLILDQQHAAKQQYDRSNRH